MCASVPRVVARAGHDLRAEQVGLLLEIAAVSEEQGAKPEIRALGDGRSRAPSDHGTAQLPGELPELQPRILRLRRIRRSVAQQDVGQLVGHHANHLAFRGGRGEHAPLHEHRPARERERVDLLQVHRRERGTWYTGLFSSAGAAATSRSPSLVRYLVMRSSLMIGYC